eukprot:PhM_4_TR11526/c0_g4_i1/m.92870/K20028/ZDHHC2_15_20; palmitoyltransferase ZDHHC2/15/20
MRTLHTTTPCQSPLRLLLSYLPVAFVYFLILWPFYAYTTHFALPMYEATKSAHQNSHMAAVAAVVMPFITISLLLASYTRCVCTQPGFVSHVPWQHPPLFLPQQASEDDRDGGGHYHAVTTLDYSTGQPRFCERCRLYKPDRAHHCRHCNRCIDRMDHHCPWIGNCVGEANHKYFLQFLMYIPVNAATMFVFLITMKDGRGRFDIERQHIASVLNFYFAVIFMGVAGLTLFAFFLLNVYLVVHDETALTRATGTATYGSPTTTAGGASGGGRSSSSFVDPFLRCCCGFAMKDVRVNLTRICGAARWRWFVPVGRGQVLPKEHERRSSSSSSFFSAAALNV